MTGAATLPDYPFAFQPIVDAESGSVFAYEALIRGAGGEPANTVLGRDQGKQLHALDRDARSHAVRLAASLGLQCSLSLNLMPAALEDVPDAVSSTLDAAVASDIPVSHLVLEVTEYHSARPIAYLRITDAAHDRIDVGCLSRARPNGIRAGDAIVLTKLFQRPGFAAGPPGMMALHTR